MKKLKNIHLADTTLRFSKFFGNPAKFWLGLPDNFDIKGEKNNKAAEFEAIKRHIVKAA